jgi:hypothetical protein
MVRYEECMGLDELLFASLGEEKSNRSLFGPGKRNIRALKWDSETFLSQSQCLVIKEEGSTMIVPLGFSIWRYCDWLLHSQGFINFKAVAMVSSGYLQANMWVETHRPVGSLLDFPLVPESLDLQLLHI